MAISLLIGACIVSVCFAYGWGVAMGYAWGRSMTALERRELRAYRGLVPDRPPTNFDTEA